MTAVTSALARGALTPGEAERIAIVVETFTRAIDTTKRREFAVNPLQILGLELSMKPAIVIPTKMGPAILKPLITMIPSEQGHHYGTYRRSVTPRSGRKIKTGQELGRRASIRL
jgi:hypothetical protein